MASLTGDIFPNPPFFDVLNCRYGNPCELSYLFSRKVSFGDQELYLPDFISVKTPCAFQSLWGNWARRIGIRASVQIINNSSVRNRQLCRYFFWFQTCLGKFYDLRQIFLAEPCTRRIGSTLNRMKRHVVRVFDILRSGYPFEVFNSVIGFNTINVVDFVPVCRRVSDEGSCNQAVDQHVFVNAARARKINAKISVTCFNWLEQPVAFTVSGTAEALNVPLTANRVNPFPPWHIFPCLRHSFNERLFSTLSLTTPN